MFINDNDVGTDWKRRRAEGTRWRSHCQERVGGVGGRLLGSAWVRETVNDREREFKRHGVCWLAVRTEGEWKVCDSGAWQAQQNKPVVTHRLLHSRLWSDRAGQPTIWDGTAYSSRGSCSIHGCRRRGERVCMCVCVCAEVSKVTINGGVRTARLLVVQ